MMIEAKNYKGIQYIQISELPQVQRESITKTVSTDQYIKILIDGKVVSDCLQYKDYSLWFSTVYRPAVVENPSPRIEPVQFEPKLAFK